MGRAFCRSNDICNANDCRSFLLLFGIYWAEVEIQVAGKIPVFVVNIRVCITVMDMVFASKDRRVEQVEVFIPCPESGVGTPVLYYLVQ
jgi:hypothetical protein